MSYIGNTFTTQAFTPAVDFFNGNGSTVAFTLSRPVASVAQVQAVISNVPQKPGDAFTVSGNTITFTSAPPSGTQNIYVYYTSPITQVIAPGQGTVGTTQIQDNAITTAKIAAGAVIPVDLSTGAPNWDTNGNVGLNSVTPFGWEANASIDMGSTGATGYGYSRRGMANNAYYDGTNWRYKYTAGAGMYQTGGGVHYFYSATSGTAAAVISFTQTLSWDYNKSVALQGANPQSGTGITFPVTQSASSDANTLDDYEEGTWTPTINLLGTVTYSARFGKYQKIGKYVRVTFALYMSSTDTTQDSTAMLISSLPFTVTNALGSDYENGSACLLTERMRATAAPSAANTFHVIGTNGTTSLVVVQNNYNSSIGNSSYFASNGRSGYFGGTMYVLGQFTYETTS
jgi:hypothetical protein